MISLRLLKYIGIAFASCLLLKFLLSELYTVPFGVLEYLLSTAFGIAFHLFVMVRLPIFRTFYRSRQDKSIRYSSRSFADVQASLQES